MSQKLIGPFLLIIETMEIVKNKQNMQVLGPKKFLKIKKKTGKKPVKTGRSEKLDRVGPDRPVRFQVWARLR
jgi:hypothetical protein